MARFHNNGDALGLENLHDGVGDLLGETFLDLEAAREHFCDTRELGEAYDSFGWDIADVHLHRISC